jgi:secreted trypsin-like serine protease
MFFKDAICRGKSQFSGGSDYDLNLNELLIPAVNSSHCYTTFTILAAVSSNRAFCGGYENSGKSPCLGDSGGGFYQFDPFSSVWNVRGIVSASIYNFDYGCDINKFSIYTNVARFTQWILEISTQTVEVAWKTVEFECVREGDW